MPRILLISQKRCGTNWLMELIGALPKTICFRDVFNPGGAFGLKPGRNVAAAAIAEHLDLPILEERDPDLIDFVRTESELFLRFVEAAIQPQGICWCGATIFDGHLSPQQFRSVISAKETLVVLLKRRNLDRAISLKKAPQEHRMFGEAMNYPGRISRSISSMVGRD